MAEKEPPNNPDHPDFIPEYDHTDRITGESFTAPFPAAVFGIHQEFFGVGKIIGSIDDNPIIEIQDKDTGESYYVMGYESWWSSPIPEEVIDNMASGKLAIASVAAYRQAQDDYWASIEMEDQTFLDDSGIDPNSLDD